MRVTAGPHNRLLTILVSAGLLLSAILLTVVLGAGQDRSPSAVTATGTDGRGADAVQINPVAAGDAAALRELADAGRRTQANACP